MNKIDTVRHFCQTATGNFGNIGFLYNCESNFHNLNNKDNINYREFEGCPANYGLEDYIGLCEGDIDTSTEACEKIKSDYLNKGINLRDDEVQCVACWKRALEGDTNELET